jgi:hypothetical protein
MKPLKGKPKPKGHEDRRERLNSCLIKWKMVDRIKVQKEKRRC